MPLLCLIILAIGTASSSSQSSDEYPPRGGLGESELTSRSNNPLYGNYNCTFYVAGVPVDSIYMGRCLCGMLITKPDEQGVYRWGESCETGGHSTVKAFVLSLLLGVWGADRYYMELYTSAARQSLLNTGQPKSKLLERSLTNAPLLTCQLKLLLTVVTLSSPFITFPCLLCIKNSQNGYLASLGVGVFALLAVIIWWFVDWISILAKDTYYDGNGNPLWPDNQARS